MKNFVGPVTGNPYKPSLADRDSEDDSLPQQAHALTRCLQLGVILGAGTCSAAVVWFIVWARMTTDPGQANLGVGLATLVLPSSLIAFGISIASWRSTTARGRIAMMLLAAILLVPSLLLLFLIEP